MLPTRRAVFVALCGLALALLPSLLATRFWPVWALFVCWLALACGIDALLLPRRDAWSLAIDPPERLYIGDADPLRATVRSATAVRRPVELLLDLSPHLEPVAAQSLAVAGGPGGGGATASFELRPRRRGRAEVIAAWLRTDGPLGLMQRRLRLPLDAPIPVVPNVRSVQAAAIRFFSRRETRQGLKVERRRGDGSEFDSLREWSQGDDIKHIDWKHTARHRKLLARQFRAERNHQIVLCVDTGALMNETVDGIAKLDHAINASLLLSYVCLKTGDRVGFFAFDARVGPYMAPRAGLRAQHALGLLTAELEGSDAETNFTLGLTALSQRLSRRSLAIVITDFVDTVTAELMLENVERLARRHLVLFVALRDPRIEAATNVEPSTVRDLHRAVVAQRFRQEREVVLRRLQTMGALAIDAEPREITTRLINAYLDIKRRERI